ncbi:hypothetical protein [Candidatus Mycoplasma haematominutum]|uniref:Uncharacterized protein n=1 Tax=Candidatus Mycoplasma haematominutum 'Birmingham 1' TaxID=1116213 RepID=G8C3Z9_9MOLU|nr:hypothetical protein [Candidatus Mycoplasma haematominutum]CCE67047.1 conserved haemoplasma hypothetical protein [Candidatus Mycoplasma haematominutum 'Birmingham 1']
MNYLYFSKKLNLFSGGLNLFSSVGWISLIFVMGYYHFYILNLPGSEEYYSKLPRSSFILNVFENLKQRTPVSSVQPTTYFASAYIAENGYGAFFSEILKALGNTVTYWTLIQPIFILSIITSSLNLFLFWICLFCSFKARKFSYIASTFVNLLVPIWGCVLTLKIHNRWKLPTMLKTQLSQVVAPGQLVKLKARVVLSKLFSEITIPA